MVILDGSGLILTANESLCAWLEKPAASLIGCSLGDALGAIAPEWELPLANLRKSKSSFEGIHLKLPAGTNHPSHWFYVGDRTRTAK